jgi:hypothetical protein
MQLVTVSDDFPPGFYDALGRLVVAFGRVEYEIKLAVKSLSDKGFSKGFYDAESESLRGFSTLCTKAKGLAAAKLTEPHRSTFSDLVDKALSLATERNDNLHALWTADGKGKPVRVRPFRDKANKTLDWRSRPATIAEMNSHENSLVQLFRALYAARNAWPPLARTEPDSAK